MLRCLVTGRMVSLHSAKSVGGEDHNDNFEHVLAKTVPAFYDVSLQGKMQQRAQQSPSSWRIWFIDSKYCCLLSNVVKTLLCFKYHTHRTFKPSLSELISSFLMSQKLRVNKIFCLECCSFYSRQMEGGRSQIKNTWVWKWTTTTQSIHILKEHG